METGKSDLGVSPAPAADACAPGAFPSPVEPVGGIVVSEPKIVPVARKAGRPPGPTANLRMELILAFVSGQLPANKEKRLRFVKDAGFTVAEKAYLLRHQYFKDFYDSRLFDMAMGIEDLTKDDIKLMSLLAGRLGLSKSPVTVTAKNVKMDNNDGGQVSIEVEK